MAIFKNNFKKILIIVEYVSTSTLDAGRWTLDAGRWTQDLRFQPAILKNEDSITILNNFLQNEQVCLQMALNLKLECSSI